METKDLIEVFELESALLNTTVRQHPQLRPLFTRDFAGVDLDAVRRAYIWLLKLHADYVCYTVPALRAAGEALRDGDAEDRRWSEFLLGYSTGETDTEAGYGHEVWARDDMLALDAPAAVLDAPPHLSSVQYGDYFVGAAAQHPYAILGAKGVLEHLSILAGDDIARGMVASGIPNAEKATRFFDEHGILDIEHVREGDRNLATLNTPQKRFDVLQGAYFTSGAYRSLVHHVVPTS